MLYFVTKYNATVHKSVHLLCSYCQGSKGIRQSPINWCSSSKIIHKNTSSVDYNWWLKLLDTLLNEPTNQNSIKSTRLLGQRIRKVYDKNLETSVRNTLKNVHLLCSKSTLYTNKQYCFSNTIMVYIIIEDIGMGQWI